MYSEILYMTAVILAWFSAFMPLLVAFFPKLGLFWVHGLLKNRLFVYLLSLTLLLMGYLIGTQELGPALQLSLVLVIFFIFLSIPLRPYKIFKSLTVPEKIDGKTSGFDKNVLILGVEIGGEAVAYPLEKMIIPRHLVNDVIQDKPVLISYCAACRSGLVYSREIKGQVLTFEVLSVWRRNMIIRDREMGTIWQQATGEAVYGELKGESLVLIGGEQLTFGGWINEHPRTALALEPEKNAFHTVQQALLMKALKITNRLHVPGFTKLGKELGSHEEIFGIDRR